MTWISRSRGSSSEACTQLVERDVDDPRQLLDGQLLGVTHVEEEAAVLRRPSGRSACRRSARSGRSCPRGSPDPWRHRTAGRSRARPPRGHARCRRAGSPWRSRRFACPRPRCRPPRRRGCARPARRRGVSGGSAARPGSSRHGDPGGDRSSRTRGRRRAPVPRSRRSTRSSCRGVPTTAVACTPRKCGSRPAMDSAATRPCRFAGPASGSTVSWPVRTSRTSLCRIADGPHAWIRRPHLPVGDDAAAWADREPGGARQLRLGRTPIARITRSASSRAPDSAITTSPPVVTASISARPSSMCSRTPLASRCCMIGAAISGSSGGITCRSFSSTVTPRPRRIRFSTISSPMKPPPTTTAVLAPRSAIQARIRRVSGNAPHGKHAGQVDPRQRQWDGCGSGRDHQRVVALVRLRPGLPVSAPGPSSSRGQWRRPRGSPAHPR